MQEILNHDNWVLNDQLKIFIFLVVVVQWTFSEARIVGQGFEVEAIAILNRAQMEGNPFHLLLPQAKGVTFGIDGTIFVCKEVITWYSFETIRLLMHNTIYTKGGKMIVQYLRLDVKKHCNHKWVINT